MIKFPESGIPFKRLLGLSLLWLVMAANYTMAAPTDPGGLSVPLAAGGRAAVRIVIPVHTTEVLRFAAGELQKYLSEISGASFSVGPERSSTGGQVRLMTDTALPEETYKIHAAGARITLTGGSGRAVLYGVYDLLGRLGCIWLAPDFSFYHGHGEYIPHRRELSYQYEGDITEQPVFAFRKIDGMGRNSKPEDLTALIEWMGKLRYNTLQIPFGSSGLKWDQWKKILIPELKKRGLIIEVGGHGYQHFLNAAMDSNRLFKDHPGWFGSDSACHPSGAPRVVFNTENPGAVHYFITGVMSYLRRHPEIDIFDLWPPDGAIWSDSACLSGGYLPRDRQARLANRVDSAIKESGLGTRLEIIAYDHTLLPPTQTVLHTDILVDFCPINQNFETQIYSAKSSENRGYQKALRAWRSDFPGDIGIYSYYRKSAWRSLPNVIPHYIGRDLKWYQTVAVQGISCYAYHDDWFTYEINHYVLGEAAWNPDINIDSIVELFCKHRYHNFWRTATAAYQMMEQITSREGSIPFTSLKPPSRIKSAEARIGMQISELQKAKSAARDSVTAANLSRLLLMMGYLQRDLAIQESRSRGASREHIQAQVEKLLEFRNAHAQGGVFQISRVNERILLLHHYGLSDQSLLDL